MAGTTDFVVKMHKTWQSESVDTVVPGVELGTTTVAQLSVLLNRETRARYGDWVFVLASAVLTNDAVVDSTEIHAFCPAHDLHISALAAARAVATPPVERIAVSWRLAPTGATCWRVLPEGCATLGAVFAAVHAAWPELPADARIANLAIHPAVFYTDQPDNADLPIEAAFGADVKQLAVLPGSPLRQIFVKTLTGCTMTFVASVDTCVADFQLQIEAATTVEVAHQSLIFAGKCLLPWAPLRAFGVEKECTLHLVLRCRGGGEAPATTTFSDMKHKTSGALKPARRSLPLWKLVCFGTSLDGRCDNPACPSQHKGRVLLHFGLGRVNIPEAVAECIAAGCPACGTTSLRIQQIIFAKCAYVAVGPGAEVVQRGVTTAEGYDHFLASGAGAAGAGFGGGADADWASLDVYTCAHEKTADIDFAHWEPTTLKTVVPLATDNLAWESRMDSIMERV